MVLETTTKIKAYSEDEAKGLIEKHRAAAKSEGYTLKKAGYEYKTKKAKGEVVGEAWVVSLTKTYNSLWEDLGE